MDAKSFPEAQHPLQSTIYDFFPPRGLYVSGWDFYFAHISCRNHFLSCLKDIVLHLEPDPHDALVLLHLRVSGICGLRQQGWAAVSFLSILPWSIPDGMPGEGLPLQRYMLRNTASQNLLTCRRQGTCTHTNIHSHAISLTLPKVWLQGEPGYQMFGSYLLP